MPLQIRRGTDAERIAMTEKLANGELLWVTDDQKLYVGNGTTASSALPPVTGFNTEDAQDAAALLFTTATHTGISFTYDDIAGQLSATVDLSAFDGPVVADSVKGSVFADDSTILVDGLNGGRINLNGTVKGNIVPNAFGPNLGSSGIPFNNVYVGGTITGNLTGNTRGYHTGDIKGSVFGDDSSKIVDAVENKIYSTFFGNLTGDSVAAGNLTLSSSGIRIGTVAPIDFYNSYQSIAGFKGINADGQIGTTPHIDIVSSRGTITAPTNSQAGDWTGSLNFGGYYNGVYQSVASIISKYDDAADLTDSAPGGAIGFATNDNNGGQHIAALDMKGVFTAPVFLAANYPTGSYPLTPAKGWIIFDSTTNHFMGYNGTSWVAFTGP
jgi:hypothetical protein